MLVQKLRMTSHHVNELREMKLISDVTPTHTLTFMVELIKPLITNGRRRGGGGGRNT